MPYNTLSKSQVFGRIFGIKIRDESPHKECGVNSHFSTVQNLLKKTLRNDKYGQNQFRKAFWQIGWPQIKQYTVTL